MADQPLIVGADLGGTTCVIQAFDAVSFAEAGEPVELAMRNVEGVDTLCAAFAQATATYGSRVGAIGFAVAGSVDARAGVVHYSPNVPWMRDSPLAARLRETCGVPVFIENDANAFTLAEATVGAAAGHRHVLGYTLGTGVGGGVVIDGRVHRGTGVGAGEAGHVCIDPHGPRCRCGARGCVEAYVGGWAIPRTASALRLGIVPEELADAAIDARLSGEALTDAAIAGDDAARQFWSHYANLLARAATPLVNVLRPSAIVFGGTGARSFDLWAATFAAELQSRVFPPAATIAIVRTSDERAGCRGAAILAADALASGSAL